MGHQAACSCARNLPGTSRTGPAQLPPAAEPILAVSDLLLSALSPAGTAAAPFSLDALSSAPSSGAAMEDWLQSVVSGGDSGRVDEAAAERQEAADAEEDEYAEELLVPGGRQAGCGPAACAR